MTEPKNGIFLLLKIRHQLLILLQRTRDKFFQPKLGRRSTCSMAEAAGLVLWVLQDRKRFDSTIEQLDFLLSNLEKISEAPKRRHGMAHKDEPEHYRYHQSKA